MQQYYLHRQFIKNGIRRNAKPIKFNDTKLLCLSNDNLVELYEFTSTGIRITNKYDMGCYIAKLEVLPSLLPNIDDYLFIVDRKGRYGFWNISGGFLNVENKMEGQRESLYKEEKGTDLVEFSGQTHHFDVFDTKGSVFFTLAHILIVIDYTINRFGLRIDRKSKIIIPYVQYRFIDWIRTGKHKKSIGLISQSEQKTTFYIHNLQTSFKLDPKNSNFEIQRMNLLQTISSNDYLVLLTDDEISVFQVSKNYLQILRFNVQGGSGKLASLGQHGFCYIGEQMVIFKGEKMRSYGALIHEQKNILEGKQVLEAFLVQQTEEQGLMICLTTITNQTLLIILHQQTWKLYFHIKALTSIYSIEPTPNPNAIIAVLDQSSETYQVAIIERQSSVKLRQEQFCSQLVEKLVPIEKGEYIIACSSEGNILLKVGNEEQAYVACMHLPSEQILALKGNILITENAIYAIGIENNFCEELTKQKIILVQSNQDRIVFINDQYLVKSIDLQTNDTSILRNGAIQEYAWCLLPNSDLIVARTDQTNALFVYAGENMREIALDNNWIINSIKSYAFESELLVEQFIIIGYINGQVHIYSQDGELKFKIDDYCCEPPTFFPVNSSTIGLFTTSKQCLIEYKENKFYVNPIQLSQSGNSILSVGYLQLYNHLIFLESGIQDKNLVRLVSLDDFLPKIDYQHKKYDSYHVKMICDGMADIPTVCLLDNRILIAVNHKLQIYSISTKRLLKTIKHYLKQVIGIFALSCGIVLYGVDSIERNLIYVFDSKDFEQICNINFILKDNKYIKALQGIPNTNNFLCRGQTFTTMCQLHCPKEIIELYELRTDLYGYSLKIDNQLKMAVETDSKRLLFVFAYDRGLLPIARYLAPSQINDNIIFRGCVIVAGKDGHIRILELNTEEKNQPLRMGMTQVGSIFVGDEVTSISRRNDSSAFYGTASGKIGIIHVISQSEWNALKCCENQINPQQQLNAFSYIPWRNRNPQQDKLIDDYLLKKYSRQAINKQLNEGQLLQYINFMKVFERLSV